MPKSECLTPRGSTPPVFGSGFLSPPPNAKSTAESTAEIVDPPPNPPSNRPIHRRLQTAADSAADIGIHCRTNKSPQKIAADCIWQRIMDPLPNPPPSVLAPPPNAIHCRKQSKIVEFCHIPLETISFPRFGKGVAPSEKLGFLGFGKGAPLKKTCIFPRFAWQGRTLGKP